jgi:hypothetical protein
MPPEKGWPSHYGKRTQRIIFLDADCADSADFVSREVYSQRSFFALRGVNVHYSPALAFAEGGFKILILLLFCFLSQNGPFPSLYM